MPRIAAPTLAEHRANVQAELIEATERLLRAGTPLTAGAVSAAAGIARNSIYRYVDSVEDLRALVVDRYLPSWLDAVEQALATATNPTERVQIWLRVNLEQAAACGHGWLMEAVRTDHKAPASDRVDQAHRVMRETVSAAWLELMDGDAERSAIAASFTVGLLEIGFRQLDAGRSLELVAAMAQQAASALVKRVG